MTNGRGFYCAGSHDLFGNWTPGAAGGPFHSFSVALGSASKSPEIRIPAQFCKWFLTSSRLSRWQVSSKSQPPEADGIPL